MAQRNNLRLLAVLLTLALLAAVAVAVYTLIGRVVREKLSTTVYTYMVYTACAAVLVVTCLVQGSSLVAHGWSAVLVGALLALFSVNFKRTLACSSVSQIGFILVGSGDSVAG